MSVAGAMLFSIAIFSDKDYNGGEGSVLNAFGSFRRYFRDRL